LHLGDPKAKMVSTYRTLYTPMSPQFVNLEDLAKITGVRETTLRHMREHGRLVKGVHVFPVTQRTLVYDPNAVCELIRSAA
jgi:hypothetical protein